MRKQTTRQAELTERRVLAKVREALTCPENLDYAMQRIQEEVAKLLSHVPETLRLKRFELEAEERRIANFVEFIAEGRGSRALAEALRTSERKPESLRGEIEDLDQNQGTAFEPPPRS